MELSHPGSDLLGATESKVLAALSRLSDPVSGRHLAKLAGAQSYSTVLRYLTKLRTIGLVRSTEIPSATLYQLNRDHAYWGPIEAILTARATVDAQIVALVTRELGDAARVATFGSVARGDATAGSDYDILLILASSVTREDRARVSEKLSALIENLTGNEGQIVDLSENELRDLVAESSPLAVALMDHARPIDGRGRIPQLRVAA